MHKFLNVPAKMKFYRQWVVWKFEHPEGRKPTKVPYSPNFNGKASVTNPSSWASFEDAVAAYERGGFDGIGFVLTRNDPFTFLDLDDVWTPDEDGVFPYGDPAEAFARQQKAFEAMPTYAELSPSGKGLHLIGLGEVERGRKRGGIEVYSSERFMTMTGDVYQNRHEIVDTNEVLNVLWHQMGGPADIYDYSTDEPMKEDDNAVIAKMYDAANGEKAKNLFEGEWKQYFPNSEGASEADFALIDIIAYYTKNRAQIMRIFGYSKLWRDKYSKRPNLVADMISRSFDRQLPPVDLNTLAMLKNEAIAKIEEARNGAPHMANGAPAAAPEGAGIGQPGGSPSAAVAPIARASTIVNPPGLVGEIADFIYAAAPRPVHEIALVGALGLVAGVSGRSFNVSGTGLNQYLMLLAPTGTGKEAIARGVGKLFSAAKQGENQVPNAESFIGPGEIRSDAALLRWIASQPCVLSIAGEFGLRLKQMSAPNASGHEIGLRKVMLDLYNKSGAGEILNPMAYSDKDKNTAAIYSPSFTMIGESTQHRFYQALDDHMALEGLLPRFTVFEYDGPRPALNEHHAWIGPNPEMLNRFKALLALCIARQSAGQVHDVEFTPEAHALMKQFDKYCDGLMEHARIAKDGLSGEFWSRAHVKAMKLAATVAVGVNFERPVIDVPCVEWATNIIVTDCNRMISKFASGEVGEVSPFSGDEVQQHKDAIKVIRDLLSSKPEHAAKYGVTAAMQAKGVIPLSALQRRLVAMASYRKGRLTASAAVKAIVQGMVDADELRQLPASQVSNEFQTTAKCFVVSNANAVFG